MIVGRVGRFGEVGLCADGGELGEAALMHQRTEGRRRCGDGLETFLLCCCCNYCRRLNAMNRLAEQLQGRMRRRLRCRLVVRR